MSRILFEAFDSAPSQTLDVSEISLSLSLPAQAFVSKLAVSPISLDLSLPALSFGVSLPVTPIPLDLALPPVVYNQTFELTPISLSLLPPSLSLIIPTEPDITIDLGDWVYYIEGPEALTWPSNGGFHAYMEGITLADGLYRVYAGPLGSDQDTRMGATSFSSKGLVQVIGGTASFWTKPLDPGVVQVSFYAASTTEAPYVYPSAVTVVGPAASTGALRLRSTVSGSMATGTVKLGEYE